MRDVTVTFTETEARSLVPWVGADHTTREWNQRLDASEDAVAKIRAALREQAPDQPAEGQEKLGGLAA